MAEAIEEGGVAVKEESPTPEVEETPEQIQAKKDAEDGIIITEADVDPPAAEKEEVKAKPDPVTDTKPKSKYQRRIDELVKKGHQQEQEIQRLKTSQPKPATPLVAPLEADFETAEEFLKADADYRDKVLDHKLDERDRVHHSEKVESAEAEVKKNEEAVSEAFFERADEVAKDRPEGFKAKIDSMGEMKMPLIAKEFILRSDYGADMAVHFVDNPEYVKGLLQTHPIGVVTALNQLQEDISTRVNKKTFSNAPPPISPIGGGGEILNKDPEKMNEKEWLDWRNKTKTIL